MVSFIEVKQGFQNLQTLLQTHLQVCLLTGCCHKGRRENVTPAEGKSTKRALQQSQGTRHQSAHSCPFL